LAGTRLGPPFGLRRSSVRRSRPGRLSGQTRVPCFEIGFQKLRDGDVGLNFGFPGDLEGRSRPIPAEKSSAYKIAGIFRSLFLLPTTRRDVSAGRSIRQRSRAGTSLEGARAGVRSSPATSRAAFPSGPRACRTSCRGCRSWGLAQPFDLPGGAHPDAVRVNQKRHHCSFPSQDLVRIAGLCFEFNEVFSGIGNFHEFPVSRDLTNPFRSDPACFSQF